MHQLPTVLPTDLRVGKNTAHPGGCPSSACRIAPDPITRRGGQGKVRSPLRTKRHGPASRPRPSVKGRQLSMCPTDLWALQRSVALVVCKCGGVTGPLTTIIPTASSPALPFSAQMPRCLADVPGTAPCSPGICAHLSGSRKRSPGPPRPVRTSWGKTLWAWSLRLSLQQAPEPCLMVSHQRGTSSIPGRRRRLSVHPWGSHKAVSRVLSPETPNTSMLKVGRRESPSPRGKPMVAIHRPGGLREEQGTGGRAHLPLPTLHRKLGWC